VKKRGLLFIIVAAVLPCAAGAETLTLQDALSKASAANPSLKVKAYEERIAEAGIALAGSAYYPRIDFQGGYTAQDAAQGITIQGRTMETQQPDFGFFNASLYQTIWDFGRRSSRYEQSTLRREALADLYRGEEKGTFLQVVGGYYAVLEARKLLDAANDEVTQMEDHLRIAKNLYEEGVVTKNDLLQAEVRLAGSRQRKLSAQNGVEKSWMNLDYLTGQRQDYRAELEENPGGGPAQACAGPVPVEQRPEMAALRKELRASELEVKANRSEFYPELFGRLGVDYIQNDKVKEQAIMAATVGLKVNLFEGNATTARLRQAVLARQRDEERLREAAAQIELEYGTACRDMAVAAERVAVTEEAIRQGEENLRINKERYKEHVGTATEVLDAQTLLTVTRVDNYRALYDLDVARARVKKARGEL
jgi:outer membrane protein